jgi:hypothetical protein
MPLEQSTTPVQPPGKAAKRVALRLRGMAAADRQWLLAV